MMKSMTGFGKGVCQTVTVEIKSVNNRFLEVNPRLPKGFNFLDVPIKKLVADHIKRGSVDIFFTITATESQYALSADFGLIDQYVVLAQDLERQGIQNDLSFSTLIRCPDVIKYDSDAKTPQDTEVIGQNCINATQIALNELNLMRLMEGNALKDGLKILIDELGKSLSAVKELAKNLSQTIKEKLLLRIKELLADTAVDESKLINEAAYLADKADIAEEILRLDSHIVQFCESLEMEHESGRKLEFLSQEIGREINTIGSKSAEIQISQHVIGMKNVLEKIKEQIRNVE